jgi:hypothetical protein
MSLAAGIVLLIAGGALMASTRLRPR